MVKYNDGTRVKKGRDGIEYVFQETDPMSFDNGKLEKNYPLNNATVKSALTFVFLIQLGRIAKHLEWSFLYQHHHFPFLKSMVAFFLDSNVSMALQKIFILEKCFQKLKLNVIKRLSSSVRFSEKL